MSLFIPKADPRVESLLMGYCFIRLFFRLIGVRLWVSYSQELSPKNACNGHLPPNNTSLVLKEK